tara:strand:+ start:1971 stop:2495 length:525 start_codon:yes stop_codon:yes gene_type:complete
MNEEEEEEHIEVVKEVKVKRKLTEKQLDNLRVGRAKMKAKREMLKREKEQGKKLIKEEKQIIKESKEIKKEVKKERKSKLHYAELQKLHLKKLKDEREEKQHLEQEEKERIINEKKIIRFEDAKTNLLLKTQNVEQYEIVENELDQIDEETIIDDAKLNITLYDLMIKYKGDNL